MSEPTLKCIISWSDRRHLCSLIADAVRAFMPDQDVLILTDETLIAYTAEDPATLRDLLSARLQDGERLVVFEFERWSSFGALDVAWLSAHGH